jgi:hypothetical protein
MALLDSAFLYGDNQYVIGLELKEGKRRKDLELTNQPNGVQILLSR